MRLTRIIAKNYKGYSNLDINLNNLNILIGKNGSGKSTIARLVPLIIESLNHKDIGPLKLDISGIDIGGRFSDFSKNQRESSIVTLGATFQDDLNEFEFSTSLMHSNELNTIIVKSFELRINNKPCIFLENAFEEKEINDDGNVYLNGITNELVKVDFTGLLPSVASEYIKSLTRFNKLLDLFYMKALTISQTLSYLGPFRKSLKRVYPYKLGFLNIGADGENAPYIFCNESSKLDGDLFLSIKNWMVSNFNEKYLSIKKSDLGFSLMVNQEKSENNIVDDGVGFSQFFPLLVNRLSNKSKKSRSIEIVEQPELHLHPAACGVVADLYLTSLESINNTVILETHSKELLLRLRRRIAEDKTNGFHERVSIIYTDSIDGTCDTNYINISSNGELDWWPEGIFEESFDEVIAISEANNAN